MTEETVFSPANIKDLRGRYHLEKLVMIGLKNSLQLQFQFITFLDGFLTFVLLSRLVLSQFHHFVVHATLLSLHLTVKWEELCGLLRSETGLFSNKLFQIRLEFLRRELVLRLCGIDTKHKQERQTSNNNSLHAYLI